MTGVNLTDLKLRKLKPSTERIDVWDARVQGFGVRVAPSGTKTFVFMYRLYGKKRRMSLGRFPTMTLANARAKAHELRALVEKGEDPHTPRPTRNDSFAAALDDFLELHCARFNKPSTQRTTKSLLTNECLPPWGDRPVSSITRQDINAVLDKMVARGVPGAANHAYAAMSKFFSWSLSRDLIVANPFIGVARPAKLIARDRVLTNAELKAVWSAATDTGYPFGNIVQLLILTGQRRGEVANMQWDHLDVDDAVWSIPAALTKNSQPHTVPLSPPALEILQSIPRLHEQFVFPAKGRTNTSFSGFGKCKQRLDLLIAAANQEPLAPWKLHDLRRTADTGMAALGTQPHVIERVLNHISGTFAGVAGTYNRYDYLDEMRDALKQWADHVTACP